MSVTSTFEAAFVAKVIELLNDTSFMVAWGRLPKGAPVAGRKEVVFFYAPGGDRQALLAGGVSAEHGRKVQVSIFSVDLQDCKDAAKAIHAVLDGWGPGTLSDGSTIFNVVPEMQDIDEWDSEEQVFQTVFDYTVRMIEG